MRPHCPLAGKTNTSGAGRDDRRLRNVRRGAGWPHWVARRSVIGLAAIALLVVARPAVAGDERERRMELGDFQLTAPDDWKRVEPKSSIVTYEFSVAPAEGDKQPGRMTVMAAGGGVEANIERWYGQFTQPDGSSTKDRAKVEKRQVAGQEVHLVDISGTFDDKPAPFAEGVKRPGYRMLAAIIATKQAHFFIKFYGPERTMAAQEKAFAKMIDGLERR